MKVGGIVLCGGRSSRMGRPKAWLPFGDEVMLTRVARILREVVEPTVVVAAPGQDVPALPAGVRIVRDVVEGRGPLQGLAAGLAALAGEVDAAYLSSCDVPFLRPAFVGRMIESLGDDDIAVPEAEGFQHPLAAVYRTSVLSLVEELLGAGRLRPAFLFEKCRTHIVTAGELRAADPDLRSLRNLNTTEDYQRALHQALDG